MKLRDSKTLFIVLVFVFIAIFIGSGYFVFTLAEHNKTSKKMEDAWIMPSKSKV